MQNNNPLSKDEIELINSFGPYDHSIWRSNRCVVGTSGLLQRRGEFILETIKKSILDLFSHEELKKITIIDIGCYDGWMLHKLSELPFKKLVGVEPREKNIKKGEIIREVLGIKSRVEFRLGDIDSLGGEKFDIVMCTGVLQHILSLSGAMSKFADICKKVLYLETICLSSRYMTPSFKKEIEMKDIVYTYKQRTCGISGQKFESSYYDGSSNSLSVVNIPSVESLMMYLDIAGFRESKVIADSKSFRTNVWKNERPSNAIIIVSLKGKEVHDTIDTENYWIRNYEKEMTLKPMQKKYLIPLYNLIIKGKWPLSRPIFLLNSLLYMRSPAKLSRLFLKMAKLWFKDKNEYEIFKNLRYNTEDKLMLEYGKLLFLEKDFKNALEAFNKIVQKLNSDWRSVYRSFYLMSLIYAQKKQNKLADKYRKYYLDCNPRFLI